MNKGVELMSESSCFVLLKGVAQSLLNYGGTTSECGLNVTKSRHRVERNFLKERRLIARQRGLS